MAKNEEKKNRTNNDMEDFDMDDIFEGTDVPEIEGRDEKAEETDSKDEKPEKEENPFETIANSLEKIVKVFEGSDD